MKTRAVRLHGVNDIRLAEFELPELEEDEILAQVITNSICMSTYKAVIQGTKHKRVPEDIKDNPVIMGHEFAGRIIEIGKKWKHKYSVNDRFAIQPASGNKSFYAAGYSYPYFGGNATYIIIPNEVMDSGCLLPYDGEAYFNASLGEPLSCIIGAFHANYHTTNGVYKHEMGIVEGGNMALLGAVGPMGLGAISYIIQCSKRPKMLVVTDINEKRLERAKRILPVEEARKNGVELLYINTNEINNPEQYLLSLSDYKGYDDVYVFAPVRTAVEQGIKILGRDGCLNFFAGPIDKEFTAEFNFYNVHYNSVHVVGTSGGNTDDLLEALDMTSRGVINSAVMITHIGGLNCAAETIKNLPNIPGGKKLIYPNIDMELVAIEDFAEKGKTDSVFAELAKITDQHKGLWSAEAEQFLLENLHEKGGS